MARLNRSRQINPQVLRHTLRKAPQGKRYVQLKLQREICNVAKSYHFRDGIAFNSSICN